eukprot:CAMPEP_0168196550 /NCGR_PEP_ID=MMETSP0139_2-20121125/20579_1 /TAXON_ID=44445 /ORGANISM="Pseudo-nitzschia australis, Strain 10249 10 AB" /LENGTH=448 /DNA_ID=CAMNT_0008120739 /DNA_START=44 /DNA_END=1390 /DNA_ORIENTATION=-
MEAFRSLLPLSANTAAVLVLILAASAMVDSFAPVPMLQRKGLGGVTGASTRSPGGDDLVYQQYHQSKTTDTNSNTHTLLFAESPQYQKQEGILSRSECVGKGSYMLYVDCVDGMSNACDYEPGHVLALEIQPPADTNANANADAVVPDEDKDAAEPGSLASRINTMSEKAQKDMKNNEGWVRGPYTVSRGYGSSTDYNGFQILVKEVGYKSHVFATCSEGTPVRFGGKFKVPIAEGILEAAEANDSEDDHRGATQRVVMVSTGVGIGPCVGASEILMDINSMSSSNDGVEIKSSIDTIDLLASFRTREEITMASDLDALQGQEQEGNHPQFRWKPVITGETGRLSASGPEVLVDQYLEQQLPGARADVSAIRNTHYHIIGNGQLLNEWTAGLKQAGVPSSRVTTEAYFNHAAKADPAAVDTICEAILRLDRDAESKEMEPKTTSIASA